jgi:hypothetical protein
LVNELLSGASGKSGANLFSAAAAPESIPPDRLPIAAPAQRGSAGALSLDAPDRGM